MRKIFCFGILAIFLLILAGCSGGGGSAAPPSVFVADILSDQSADGDIAFDPVFDTYTITNGPSTLFFGIDNLDAHWPEYRAFLDFPLDGSTGKDVVPASAAIISATMEVFLNEVSFAAVIPTLIDLVTYPVAGLEVLDFDSAPLLTQGVNFFPVDQGTYVSIDVTPLMREAQRLGLADFQVRFLLDLAVNAGFVGIEDLVNVALTAPQLTVAYTL